MDVETLRWRCSSSLVLLIVEKYRILHPKDLVPSPLPSVDRAHTNRLDRKLKNKKTGFSKLTSAVKCASHACGQIRLPLKH